MKRLLVLLIVLVLVGCNHVEETPVVVTETPFIPTITTEPTVEEKHMWNLMKR